MQRMAGSMKFWVFALATVAIVVLVVVGGLDAEVGAKWVFGLAATLIGSTAVEDAAQKFGRGTHSEAD